MTDARRRTLLFTALAVALAWSGWLAFNGNPEDEAADLVKGVDGPATRMNTRCHRLPAGQIRCIVSISGKTPGPARSRAAHGRRPRQFIPQANLVHPAATPTTSATSAAAASAALTLQLHGSWQEDNTTTYYLTRGSMPVSVHAGQVLDGTWQLEPVTGKTLKFHLFTPETGCAVCAWEIKLQHAKLILLLAALLGTAVLAGCASPGLTEGRKLIGSGATEAGLAACRSDWPRSRQPGTEVVLLHTA